MVSTAQAVGSGTGETNCGDGMSGARLVSGFWGGIVKLILVLSVLFCD